MENLEQRSNNEENPLKRKYPINSLEERYPTTSSERRDLIPQNEPEYRENYTRKNKLV